MTIEDRKKDHINLAHEVNQREFSVDDRFCYNALSSFHQKDIDLSLEFLGHKLDAPIWISSMTGGAKAAKELNQNLSKIAGKYKIGMGLGSIRPFIEDNSLIDDFNVRKNMGDDLPLFVNLGIAQVEHYLYSSKLSMVVDAVKALSATGLIIHINSLQEFAQPEGDMLEQDQITTLKRALDSFDFPVIVKEVGVGFSHSDMKELSKLPIKAIEFGAFGGTNFTEIELLRSSQVARDVLGCLSHIGHTAQEMVRSANEISRDNSELEFIVSGGIKSFLDGYYLTQKLDKRSPYGMAYRFLKYAHSYDLLDEFLESEISGLKFAHKFLEVK